MRKNLTFEQVKEFTGPTVIGRVSSLGPLVDLDPAEFTSILNSFTSLLQGAVPASGGGTTNFLRADGTWANPGIGGNLSGTLTATRIPVASGSSTLVDEADLTYITGTNTMNIGASTSSSTGNLNIGGSSTGTANLVGGGTAFNITGGDITIEANTGKYIAFETGTTERLRIGSDGSWSIGGSVGTAGQVLRSAGSGAPPVWSTVSGLLSGLTAGRVPYVLSSTAVVDEAGFEYDAVNNRLTVEALDLGASTVSGATRTLRSQGSAADVGLNIGVKGSGEMNIISGGKLFISSAFSYTSIGGSNVSLFFHSPNFQSMLSGVFFGNSSIAPSGNPADGVFLWTGDSSSSAELYLRTESGAVMCLSGLVDSVAVSGTTLSLTEAHRGKIVYFTNAGAITVTVPSTLKKGYWCILMQEGAGTVSVVGSGATINGKAATTGVYDTIGLFHYKDTDVYLGR